MFNCGCAPVVTYACLFTDVPGPEGWISTFSASVFMPPSTRVCIPAESTSELAAYHVKSPGHSSAHLFFTNLRSALYRINPPFTTPMAEGSTLQCPESGSSVDPAEDSEPSQLSQPSHRTRYVPYRSSYRSSYRSGVPSVSPWARTASRSKNRRLARRSASVDSEFRVLSFEF